MVLFSYSRIYRDQRLSARITRGIFVASYKGILKSKQDACSGVYSACRREEMCTTQSTTLRKVLRRLRLKQGQMQELLGFMAGGS